MRLGENGPEYLKYLETYVIVERLMLNCGKNK